jgi:hypothetical protein
LTALGFPIRESAGHWLFSASPRLIAAVHALHRLLVPRHPPCALPILTVITRSTRKGRTRGDTRSHLLAEVLRWHDCAVFKVRARRVPGLGTRSLKTQQHGPTREARDPGPVDIRNRLELAPRGMRDGPSPALHVLELPRKEVIQPHLPVRLPCYDFTPVTSPTFDGSLPEG